MKPLWPGQPPYGNEDDEFCPYIETYLCAAAEIRGTVVILPGGGYSGRAEHESAPVAERFVQAGMHAFVAHYRVSPNRHPAPLADAVRAVRIARTQAAAMDFPQDKIALLGFSAGGHLAASAGVYHDQAPGIDDAVDAVSGRPDALILSYPVITSGEFRHEGSMINLYGPNMAAEDKRRFSLEHAVTSDTPPTFLWHTAEDAGVPVENSLLFASALRKHRVPFELHVFPHGAHGAGLSAGDDYVARWFEFCVKWLKSMGW